MRHGLSHCGWLALAAGLAGDLRGADYLPSVGPPPLRFAPPASPSAVRYELPPLPPPATNESAAVTTTTNQPAAPAATFTNAMAAPPPGESAFPPAPPPHFLPYPSPSYTVLEGPPVSPQMFLQYFTRGPGTNGPGVSAIVPLNFQPPTPLVFPPPSSTATYDVTPAPKP